MSTLEVDVAASEPVLLTCPIRGSLRAEYLAKDGLTPTEEARRIDFIRYLLKRNYPALNIGVETVVVRGLGEKGRNKLRADVIVYDQQINALLDLPTDERLAHAVLVAEIKRESKSKASGIENQLIPALRVLPGMNVLGAYWDDINQILLYKELIRDEEGASSVVVREDSLANLPDFGQKYRAKPIVLDTLLPPENLVGTLHNLANVMRSQGVNDEQTRYRETVKLILARYVDEKAAKSRADHVLDMQVHEGGDPDFSRRVGEVYKTAALRYDRAKSLYEDRALTKLSEGALRACVGLIQGISFSSASKDVMQQVFMSFVPSVFKKSLDQYFTPITLIDSMIEMVDIGPNDKVADPAMGTADFLSAAMAYRTAQGDDDAAQRVFGVDKDPQAYELAVINMILNRDGQSNLHNRDSLEDHALWQSSMNVVLCNPPFGARTVETRASVLGEYDLGHQWNRGSGGGWSKSTELMSSQQLGLLFIERSYKLLADGGRLAIILPEGYLCTASYGYVRQWLLERFQILSLVELPRRIFLKSDADLRSNVLIARKLSTVGRPTAPYPIHTEVVRKVGYKLGKSFAPIARRDAETGMEIRDEKNELVLDTDFERVRRTFEAFLARTQSASFVPIDWRGATSAEIFENKQLDLKPRRLAIPTIENMRQLRSRENVRLGDIADVLDGEDVMVNLSEAPAEKFHLVEGEDIRAVEGVVLPKEEERAWRIAERKATRMYRMKSGDIVVGLVRPERRNIGMLLSEQGSVVGSPDGIAIVRPKAAAAESYPAGWLFAMLRSEAVRLQLWTESGGTSYGKLTKDNIRDVILPVNDDVLAVDDAVRQWSDSVVSSMQAWDSIGTAEDRRAVRNSALIGFELDEEATLDD